MFEERLLLPGDVLLELQFRSPSEYRLACLKGDAVLVEYTSAGGHEFKSVEQLRYDFQRDAENALHQD